jgi:hypothetical protein
MEEGRGAVVEITEEPAGETADTPTPEGAEEPAGETEETTLPPQATEPEEASPSTSAAEGEETP